MDVYANVVKAVAAADQTGSAETVELVGSFLLNVDPAAQAMTDYTLYLPVVNK